MYKQIMVPVDLGHLDQLGKALSTAADLAAHYKISVCYVAVGPATPTEVAHNPTEFAEKLNAFAVDQSKSHGQQTSAKAYTSADPATDLDDVLLKAVSELGADLVVMASHIPTVADYIWPSNGGKIASHAETSVFLVR